MRFCRSCFVFVVLIGLSISTAFAQTSPRNQYRSGTRSNPRAVPVRYRQEGDLPSPDGVIRDSQRGLIDPDSELPRSSNPLTRPSDPAGDLSEPGNAPDLMPEEAPAEAAELGSGTMPPDALPKPKPPAAPQRVAPQHVAPEAVIPAAPAQQVWEQEVDRFAGHNTWDGGGPGCCDSCGGGSCCGDSCGGGCGGGCGCRGGGWYGRGEYLLMWADGQDVPALVTTSPVGTARADAGVLGLATTSILYGDDMLNADSRSGARAAVGYWFGPRIAVEAEYFNIGESLETYTLTSANTGIPTIARPFVDVNGNNVANLIAVNLNGEAALIGNIGIEAFSSFEGTSLSMRYAAAETVEGCRHYQLDYLAGYRYARLQDRLTINSTSRSVETRSSVPVGTVFDVNDEFVTNNRFLGADFGVNVRMTSGCYTLDVLGKVAVGSVAREVEIRGSTVTRVPGQTAATSAGGLYTQRSNIGTFRDDNFSVMPEVGIKLGMSLHPNLRLTAGYNFIVLANVVRAGEQIDTTINTTQASNRPLVGDARPAVLMKDSGFWAHGLGFGIEGEF